MADPVPIRPLAARKRRQSNVRQLDIKRAIKAATAAGLHVQSVTVDPLTGKIHLGTGEGTSSPAEANPFDEWQAKQNARRA